MWKMDVIDFFKFPDKWDIAKSEATPQQLAVYFDKHLSRFGVKSEIGELGSSYYYVVFPGAQIQIKETDYGCEIKVTILDRKQEKDLARFFGLWKNLVDKDPPFIWGGHYTKDILKIKSDETNNEQKQPKQKSTASVKPNTAEMPEKYWEHFEDKETSDKVFAFLTFEENLDILEGFFMMGAKNGKRFSVEMAMLRKLKKFPDSAKGRRDFRKRWEKYLQQANDEERAKYQELRERILNGK
jgi:hypothetical protein